MVHHAQSSGRLGVLSQLAVWCFRHRRAVLALWVVLALTVAVAAWTMGGRYANSVSLPGTDSQRAADLLSRRFPAVAGDTGVIVFRTKQGRVTDPAVEQRMQQLFRSAGTVPDVAAVGSPYPVTGGQVSADGRIAFATIQFSVQSMQIPKSSLATLERLTEQANAPGLQVELGGQAVAHARQTFGAREGLGLLAALFVLLLAFGSVLAAGLPLLVASLGLGSGLALIALLSRFLSVPDATPQLAAMIGLGVGIDYAMLLVTRFRQGIRSGLAPLPATAVAAATAGRSVLLAGTTVLLSLAGIFLMGLDFVNGIALGAMVSVALTVLVALTLLPATFGFLGRHIDQFRLPRMVAGDSPYRRSLAFRWASIVQRHPRAAFLAALALLLPLSLPVLSIRLGVADAGRDPTSLSTRRAYDLLAEGFGPGFNGPLLLAVERPASPRPQDLDVLAAAVQATRDVALVAPPQVNAIGDTALVTVIPSSSPQDPATGRLVTRLRTEVLPQVRDSTGLSVSLGGITAVFIDMSNVLSRRLWLVIAAVIVMSFVVLTVVFRSLVVPLKAALMNLLSVGAAYGVLVAVFQWGWLKAVVGIDRTGPIESYLPPMLFAVLFGLSMDYEVFLLSRIREEYERTGDTAGAVADGLALTTRVITAAAAIMVTVFVSFALGDTRVVKLAGVGLAVAVLLDATVIRLVLVPSAMELLGRANWWMPGWLQPIVPRLRWAAPEPPGTGVAPSRPTVGAPY